MVNLEPNERLKIEKINFHKKIFWPLGVARSKSDGRRFLVRSSLVENIRFYLSKSAFSEPCLGHGYPYFRVLCPILFKSLSAQFEARFETIIYLERRFSSLILVILILVTINLWTWNHIKFNIFINLKPFYAFNKIAGF